MLGRPFYRLLIISILVMLGLCLPKEARLQAVDTTGIHRCEDAEGNVLYTDKICVDLKMLDKPKTQTVTGISGGNSGSRYIRSCAHTEEDLLWEARGAFETGDVNRAAGLFLWNGSNRETSNKRLDQLNKINYRSLISVDLMYPETQQAQVQFDEDGNIIEAPQTRAPAPYGIRVSFYTDKKNTQISSMRFGLQRAVTCWWLQF
jgi:hypothetical protein